MRPPSRRPELVLYLRKGYLLKAKEGKRALDLSEITTRLGDILRDPSRAFFFEPRPLEPPRGKQGVRMEALLLRSTAYWEETPLRWRAVDS